MYNYSDPFKPSRLALRHLSDDFPQGNRSSLSVTLLRAAGSGVGAEFGPRLGESKELRIPHILQNSRAGVQGSLVLCPSASVRPSDRKLNAAFAIFSGSSSLIFLLLNKCNGGSDENLATLNDAAAAAAASAATQFASAHQMSISPHLSHLTHARAL